MQLQAAKSPVANQSEMTDLTAILIDLRCPISQDLFFYPVTLDDGHTYEREEIEQWLIKNKTSPKTSLPVKGKLKPNHAIKSILQGLLQRHPQHWKDVYLSAELRRQVLEKIEAENANELLALINRDPRLLIEKIKENQTILELVCAKKTKLFLAQTIKKLLPRAQQNVINHFQPRSADLFVSLARSHEIADIKIMAEALYWQPGFYFAQAIAAIKDGDQAILNVCLDLGVSADDLLHIAIRENAEAIVQLLLQRGANPFSVNAEQQTAIETATKLPSNTLLSLLAKHVEPNKLFSVLSEKLSVEGVIEVAKLLNWNTEFYQQQAWRAVHEKALPALRVCCATGIDLQFKSKNKKYKGNTLLHLSIKNGFNDGAIILIDAGASIGIENRQH